MMVPFMPPNVLWLIEASMAPLGTKYRILWTAIKE